MDWITEIRAVVTVVSFVVFIAICWWALSARRKANFEEAARLPLNDDDLETALRNAERKVKP